MESSAKAVKPLGQAQGRLQSVSCAPEPQCGLQVIDLRTGTIAHWLRLDGMLVTELYDAVVLPGIRQPMAVGFQTNEIERLLLVDEVGEL